MPDKVAVQPMDDSKKNSPVAGPVDEEATVIMNRASKTCVWNDRTFSEGEMVECERVTYECNLGQWVKR